MPAKPSSIEHFNGENSHGPVTLFIADNGEMVLVCERDKQAWRLPTAAEAIKESVDGGDGGGGRRRRTNEAVHSPLGSGKRDFAGEPVDLARKLFEES